MKPLITALIDTYNHERYIEQALVSALEQGFSQPELEIIVVDDGSTDHTPEIIRKFAPRVRHVRKENGGQASAFNTGYRESRGDILAILDGDDWWMKGKLTAVAEALEKQPEIGAVGHGRFEFDQERNLVTTVVPPARQLIHISNLQAARDAIPYWPCLLMGALTVRRKVLDAIMPLPEQMTFMADTALQCAAMAMTTLILPDPLFYYRHHAQNLYAGDQAAQAKLRRKYAMTELVHERVFQMLLRMGVRRECASVLLEGTWMEAKRWRLSRYGGSRLETLRTELQAFHASVEKPSAAYRAFKYAVVGGATLLLPPATFYRAREWYAKRELGRARHRLVGTN